MNGRKIGLMMRKGYKIQEDHIETLGRLVEEIHIWTSIHNALDDPRFQYVHLIEEEDQEVLLEEIYKVAKQYGVSKFVTFQETDIVLTAQLNERFGNQFIPADAAKICRDKSKQRAFMSKYNLPTPYYYKVDTLEDAILVSKKIKFPFILKPTLAASSSNVSLIKSEQQLKEAFKDLENLRQTKRGFYYNKNSESLALIEEFLSGDEVTVDGVVINGEFHLGGIHNKKRMEGPYFEEDEYTLPFAGTAESEKEIVTILKRITKFLNLRETLLNVELRKDNEGRFKIVEFSVRISGGHVYRNIRDVYNIDLVGSHISSIFDDNQGIHLFSRRLNSPKASTCIKFIYKNGLVKKNNVGKAGDSPYFRAYYPTASVGQTISCAPNGFDITGLLSVRYKYSSPEDRLKVIEIAKNMEKELDLEVVAEKEEGETFVY
ncbi:ATP-grasp domain-containing protein [Weizmannia sp. FSL W8-0401]|uniref:ATP-grasp domain-containing protein n=1 Tax=Weizmannia sp. FSL W8-0401 TaxID=2954554 RepID=UPI0030F710D8